MANTSRDPGGSRFGDYVDPRDAEQLGGDVRVSGVRGGIQINTPSVNRTVMHDLAKFGAGKIRQKAEKEYNKSYLEGQMANLQGQEFEEVETGGDKWKLEGWRVMQAQTLASTLLAEQEADIDFNSYADNPDAYREKYVSRADALLDGQDPRVQEMVREQLTKQAPVLAARHTSRHVAYNNEQNYNSAVEAIAVTSKDPTAEAEFNALITGDESGPMGAMGPKEREAAITDGIIAALNDDNPLAYAKAAGAGAIDSLPVEQRTKIKSANQAYKQRLRQANNIERLKAHEEFSRKAELGEFETPADAAIEWARIEEQFGIDDVTYDEAATAAAAGRAGISVREATTGLAVQESMLQGDWAGAARQVSGALANVESGGNYASTGTWIERKDGTKDRAYGKYQVMGANIPGWTKKWLGYSMTPDEFLASPAAQEKVFEGQFGDALSRHGNVEDAISEWHSGVSLTEAKRQGRADINMSTEAYVNRVMGHLGESPASRYEAKKAVVSEMMEGQAGEQFMAFKFQADELVNQYVQGGEMTRDEFRSAYADLVKDNNQKFDATIVNDMLAADTERGKFIKSGENPQNVAIAEEVFAKIGEAGGKMHAVVNDPVATDRERREAIETYNSERRALLEASGLPRELWQDQQHVAGLAGVWKNAQEATARAAMLRADVAKAASDGALGSTSGLDKALVKEYWNGELNNIKKQAISMASKDPNMSGDDVDNFVQAQTMELISRTGYIPDSMTNAYSAVLTGAMLDKNGNPSDRAISAVEDYLTLKTLNPNMGDKLLNPDAQAVAEVILQGAGNDPRQIPFMIQNREAAKHLPPGVTSPSEYIKTPEAQAAVSKAVKDYTTSGWFEDAPSAWNERTADPIFQAAMRQEIEREVMSTYVNLGGQDNPNLLATIAAKRVMDRTTFLGGTPFVTEPGQDIFDATFGSGIGNKALPPGSTPRKNSEVVALGGSVSGNVDAVDTAIKEWVVSKAGQPGSGIPTTITALPWEEDGSEGRAWYNLPGQAMDAILNPAVAGMVEMGGDVEGQRVRMIDYTPSRVEQTEKGLVLHVWLHPNDGGANVAATIPLYEAGEMYLNKAHKDAAASTGLPDWDSFTVKEQPRFRVGDRSAPWRQ